MCRYVEAMLNLVWETDFIFGKTSVRSEPLQPHQCPAAGAATCRIPAPGPASACVLFPVEVQMAARFTGLISFYHAFWLDLYTLVPLLASFTAGLQLGAAAVHYFNTAFDVATGENVHVSGLLSFSLFLRWFFFAMPRFVDCGYLFWMVNALKMKLVKSSIAG